MDKYVNASEILTFAVRIEENGGVFYSKCADIAEGSSVQFQLKVLAGWEDGHIARLKELFNTYSDGNQLPLYFSPEEDTEQYIKALADQHIFIKNPEIETILASCKNVDDILAMALQFEQDSVKFYRSLCERIADSEAREVLMKITEEEEQHVLQIQNLIESEKR